MVRFKMQSKATQGYALLLLTASLWGTAFIFQKNATQYIDAFSFNFLRFGLAVPALCVLYLLPKKFFQAHDVDVVGQKSLRHSAWFIGAGGGFFMFVGISLQQWGLAFTTAGKSGFLTSLYIIVVPILALFIGKRCHLEVWVGAVVTVLGVYLLGSGHNEDMESQFNKGDVMMLVGTLMWASQVLWLSILARYANVLNIAIMQMVTVAGLSFLVILLLSAFNHYVIPAWETLWSIKYDILYTAVIATAIAFTLQILGQLHVPAANAALIMSTEALFALLSGILFLDEQVTIITLLACLLILIGIILAQLQGKVFARRK